MKVFLWSSLALTIMLSIGIILRPVQEYGVGPGQVVHVMGYVLPITLTFVLPIAALFSASLVYGRFSSDNELDACRASGISLWTLVYPGLALAIIVATANLILSFHVMPTFVRRAARSFKADAKQILFRNIQRRGYYKLPPEGKYLIYADVADSRNDTLSGVVVVKVEGAAIARIITAEDAKVVFNPHQRFNEVQITAHNTFEMGPEYEGALEWLVLTTEFGSVLGDDIKFKKLNEMKRIRDGDLMLFGPIAKLAHRVYGQLRAELLARDVKDTMSRFAGPTGQPQEVPEDTSRFYKLYSGRKFVEFAAAECRVTGEKEVELSRGVVVVESNVAVRDNVIHRERLRTLWCKRALLRIDDEEFSQTLTMELSNPTWQETGRKKESAWGWVRIRGLILPESVEAATSGFRRPTGLDATKLALPVADFEKKPSAGLRTLQRYLEQSIQMTLAEIEAETHSRLVFGVGCVSMIMIGIGLGILLKGGHLLTAFGVSCIPAALLIVCIMMGKNITKNPGSQAGSGIVLMWMGLVLLSVFAMVVYRRLLRH
jgi:lipopolysaccharide export LptBFGC system permease protein LptF